MAKTKTVFHEFDPVIYPFKIWVATNPDSKRVINRFYNIIDKVEVVEFQEDWLNDDGCKTASTYPVAEKKSGGQGGLFVKIYKPKRMTVNIIAHEASHCADYIAEVIGLSTGNFNDGEAYAYLIGWIAECIEKATKHTRAAKKKKK